MAFATSFDLTGRGIGLTGGGGHLGRAMAIALAQAGATVVIAGRQREALEGTQQAAAALGVGERIVPFSGDTRDGAVVEAMLDCIETHAGRVDAFINNACNPNGELLFGLTERGVTEALAGTCGAQMLLLQATARRMMAHRRGSIVNVSSMYGLVSPQPAAYEVAPDFHNPPAYGAAKAALLQFTRYAACHLGPYNIRVNALVPGPFPTPEVVAHEAFRRQLEQRVPLGRVGQPEEVAGAAVFLVGDASTFVTGSELVVDGGWTAW